VALTEDAQLVAEPGSGGASRRYLVVNAGRPSSISSRWSAERPRSSARQRRPAERDTRVGDRGRAAVVLADNFFSLRSEPRPPETWIEEAAWQRIVTLRADRQATIDKLRGLDDVLRADSKAPRQCKDDLAALDPPNVERRYELPR